MISWYNQASYNFGKWFGGAAGGKSIPGSHSYTGAAGNNLDMHGSDSDLY